jgi:hypothetical protein
MNRRAILAVVLLLFAVAAAAVFIHIHHQSAIGAELRLAYAAVGNAEDYNENAAFGEADLAARERLDALDVETVDQGQAKARDALRSWLESLESLVSSHTSETAVLRAGIADKARGEAVHAMAPFLGPAGK